jgi:hypothetical protein
MMHARVAQTSHNAQPGHMAAGLPKGAGWGIGLLLMLRGWTLSEGRSRMVGVACEIRG